MSPACQNLCELDRDVFKLATLAFFCLTLSNSDNKQAHCVSELRGRSFAVVSFDLFAGHACNLY